jgi:pimeloyl-ACP methyl ester carboxylesterase
MSLFGLSSRSAYTDVSMPKMFARLDHASQNKGNVVLIHGLMGSSSKDVDPLAQKLLAAGYNVLRADLFGHGESLNWQIEREGQISRIYPYEDNVRELAKILEKANFTDATFIGHSYGGATIYALAKYLEDNANLRPQKIVLMAPYLRRLDNNNLDGLGMSWMTDPYVDNYMHTEFKKHILKQMGKEESELTAEEKAYIEIRIKTAIGSTKGIRKFDLFKDYDKWELQNHPPLLLLSASNDELLPPDYLDRFADILQKHDYPHRYVILPNTDHMFPQDNSKVTAVQILEFLKDNIHETTPTVSP